MLRLLFFGMTGQFSRVPLEALLAAGYDVRALVLPALSTPAGVPPYTRLTPPSPRAESGRRALPVLGSAGRTTLQIAAEREIPILEVARLAHAETITALEAFAPDAICVACFTRRLPPAVLRLPRFGCLNVHPSLLPDNRGPDPLFWTFRRGDAETGATIHLMDAGLDTGPILLQGRVPVPEGVAEAELERQVATLGGELLVRALASLSAGTLTPSPQDERLATAYPVPSPADFTISPDRPARWAFTFARGVIGREQPLTIEVENITFRVLAPLGYDADATLTAPYRLLGDILTLRCAPGVFTARVQRL